MHRGRRKLLRSVRFFMETVPRDAVVPTKWKVRNWRLNLYQWHKFKYLQQNECSIGFVIVWLIHPLLRGIIIDHYDNLPRSLQFCIVLINEIPLVALSTNNGTGSGQCFWPSLSQFEIERVIKQFPLLYHNFWLQGCVVADDIFLTFSMVLGEVI